MISSLNSGVLSPATVDRALRTDGCLAFVFARLDAGAEEEAFERDFRFFWALKLEFADGFCVAVRMVMARCWETGESIIL